MKYRLRSFLSLLAAATLLFSACSEKECPSTKAFAIGDGHYVEFSRANLRYNCYSKTYSFAVHQYDMVGMSNQSISTADYTGYIDLFGWGTGKNPLQYVEEDSLYWEFNDWGDCSIDSAGTGWRTLSYAEWDYLLEQRPNAAALRGAANVLGVKGLIILPDKWTGGPLRGAMDSFDDNDFNTIEKADSVWSAWESQGAVFLPAAGQRKGSKVSGSTQYGRYWTSTPTFFNNAYYVGFMASSDASENCASVGRSVRLVKDVQ